MQDITKKHEWNGTCDLKSEMTIGFATFMD